MRGGKFALRPVNVPTSNEVVPAPHASELSFSCRKRGSSPHPNASRAASVLPGLKWPDFMIDQGGGRYMEPHQIDGTLKISQGW